MSTASPLPQTSAPQRPFSALLVVVLISVLLSSSTGCRSTRDNQIDILESELRAQEDYIYELEDYVVEYSEKLRKYRGAHPPQTKVQSQLPEPELADDRPHEGSHSREADEKPILEPDDKFFESDEPEPEPVQPSPLTPEELEVPDLELEIGEPVSDFHEEPPLDRVVAATDQRDASADDEVLFIPDPVDFEPLDEAESLPDEPLNLVHREVVRLEITHVLRNAGDDQAATSLLAVVEARDADDEPVDFDGEVSLMVMRVDAASPRRIKRWDFTPEETLDAWQSSYLGDGLHLELPLDQLTLPDEPLELWARLVTAEGRKLLTQLPFKREQLVALETEADGEELHEHEEPLLAENDTPSTDQTQPEEPRARKLPSPVEQAEATTPRWRPSLQRTDATAEGFASTKSKTQRWTAQPAGGRMPLAPPTIARRSTGEAISLPKETVKPETKKTVWTSGQGKPTPLSQAVVPAGAKRPQWSPYR